MSLRFHEIAEANHRILNPLSEAKLRLLGEICRLSPGQLLLDLACGKGEMLCQWANRWGIRGIGVDISKVFLEAAHERAKEMGVLEDLTFIEADAGTYMADANAFDVVSCLGATWIGNGLIGTLKLLQKAVKPGGLLLVGEPYWVDEPPAKAYEDCGGKDNYVSLAGTLARFDSLGLDLVEMVLSSPDDWDRYAAAHWWTVHEWLKQNPDDPDAEALRQWSNRDRANYLDYGRRYLGWGVFVLRS
jgi:SAM-dependent methyltransferase